MPEESSETSDPYVLVLVHGIEIDRQMGFVGECKRLQHSLLSRC